MKDWFDNRKSEYFKKALIMNGENESIRYLIDMLTRKGVQETQSATKYESLFTRVNPIIDAIHFVISASLPLIDFQDEYPNKRVDILDKEYRQDEDKIRDLYIEIRDMRDYLVMFCNARIMKAMYLLSLPGVIEPRDIDVVKSRLIDTFKDVQAMTMQKIQQVELP